MINFNVPSYVGEELYLRAITPKDTLNILRWRNSGEVKKYFILREDITEKDHEVWLKKIEEGAVCQFIICRKGDGAGIGSVYLQNIDRFHGKAEYGIFIGDVENRGKGYGRHVTVAVLQHAFSDMGLNRIYLRVLPRNDSAIRCYESVGFQREGVLRQSVCISGEYQDVLIMGILREEFDRNCCY